MAPIFGLVAVTRAENVPPIGGARLPYLASRSRFRHSAWKQFAVSPPQSRGAALGAYAACFDVAMGVGVPLLGLLAGAAGYRAPFLAGALASVISVTIAVLLSSRAARRTS